MTEKTNQWNSTLGFLLAMIGSAVGLGNIWRFPYIAYTNGGGTFLIPYIVAILCMGAPFIFIEYGAGYKFKAGLSKTLRTINKKYEYIAWTIQMVPFLILSYYTCIIGWNLIYLILSFFKGWGTDTNTFFTHTLLQTSNNPLGILHIVLPIFIAVAVSWFIIWFVSHKNLNDGVETVCKIVIPLLFVLMAGIVIYSLTLPGAFKGVSALFTPEWSQLTNFNIWLAAFGQIVFSLSLGLCIMFTYASYLPDDINLVKNGLTVAFTNSGFEVFTAIGMFSILGFMSLVSNVPIDQVVTNGAGLAFVVLPSVFNTMGTVGYIIGPLFFICLFFAGFTSAIALVEPLNSSISEKFNLSRKKTVSMICLVGFLISILFTTTYGSSLLTYFDGFLNQFGLLLTVIIECIIFGWIYGLDKLLDAINSGSNFKLGKIWKFMIKYFIPIIVGIMWIRGNYTSFTSSDSMQVLIQFILLVVLFIVPVIFYKLPSKVKNY
ncbi:sodium-dependent transporter [Methanobrevibacter sp. 87.7]|uniref:sodium-dependent transporter n=1 Tax=Methanobrevibacter sp. 87.7 TaxID=387957 RepID=UPI000B510CF1|nr:sodium-dependent transporter [Methanobrevibacter sp. 87.7]OWT33715.1 sodium-dependent transporter [Methanobrevibacter sp. 87.7]